MASLTIGNKTVLVSDEDLKLLEKFNWKLDKKSGSYYARLTMHRVVMALASDAPSEVFCSRQVDHVNCNRDDNRRENLRLCTATQNARNKPKSFASNPSSQYKGVYWNRRKQKWHCTVTLSYRSLSLGYYADEKEAAMVYDAAARYYYGEFANTNFQEGQTLSKDQIDKIQRKMRKAYSGYFGVTKSKDGWIAQTTYKHKRYYLGIYGTEEEAARAYDGAILYWQDSKKQQNFEDSKPISPETLVMLAKSKRRGTSKYVGVSKSKDGRWRARIFVDYKELHLGTFDSEDEAASEYNKVAENYGKRKNVIPSYDNKSV